MLRSTFSPLIDGNLQTDQNIQQLSSAFQPVESFCLFDVVGQLSQTNLCKSQISSSQTDESSPVTVLRARTEECAICYEIPKNFGVQENCAHIFCGTCLKAWRLPDNNASCPLCRVASLRALVTDTMPTDAEFRSQLFEQLYRRDTNQSLHNVPRSAWSSNTSSNEDVQLTPIIQRSQRTVSTVQESWIYTDTTAFLNRTPVETRRRRWLTHKRRFASTQRRWTALLAVLRSAEGRVDCARRSQSTFHLLIALRDYVSCLHSGAAILRALSFDAGTLLQDVQSSGHQIHSTLPYEQSSTTSQDVLGTFGNVNTDLYYQHAIDNMISERNHDMTANMYAHYPPLTIEIHDLYQQPRQRSMNEGTRPQDNFDRASRAEATDQVTCAARTIHMVVSYLRYIDESL